MAITQNIAENPSAGSVVFPTLLVNLRMEGRWAAPKLTHAFPGLAGVKHYLDFRKERAVIADVHLYDRPSLAGLYSDLLIIENLTHELVGALDIDGTEYPPCTFEGIEYLGPDRWDPHHYYHRKARLHWTQRFLP